MKDKPFLEEDFFSLDERKENLFLGKYTISQVYYILERRGFIDFSKNKGLYPILFDLSWRDPFSQNLKIYFKEKDESHKIVDLILKEKSLSFRFPDGDLNDIRFLFIEWICIQNPTASFTKDRPKLPYQLYPGLGLGERLWSIFELLVRFLRVDGVMIMPKFLHNAIMYRRLFHFLNPAKEGEVSAILRDLGYYHLAILAWGSYHGCIFEEDKVFEWKAEPQIFPQNRRLKNYFSSSEYQENVKKEMEKRRFSLNLECVKRKEPSLFE